MTSASGYAGCFIYVRMSAADIRSARTRARGNPELLAQLLAEKLAVHRDECRRYAADEGWPVLGEYADNMVSGNARYRNKGQGLPERDALLADLRDRAGQRVIVLSTEVERLYRDADESRVLIEIARRTPVTVVGTDGEEYDLTTANGEDRFNGAVSKGQRESAKVSERRRRRERKRAESGGYWGNEPFGYHKVYEYDPATGQRVYTGRLELCTGACCALAGRDGCTHHGNGCWLDPARPLQLGHEFWHGDPDDYDLAGDDDEFSVSGPLGEAELIQVAAVAVTRGASLASQVRDWDAMGVTTRNGTRWSQITLRGLLLNKRLNGVRVHRAGDKWGRADRKSEGTETPGQWPAILDDDLFAAMAGVLTAPERYKHLTPATTRGAREHLLAGLAVCGNVLGPEFGIRAGQDCGARMKGHPAPRSRNKARDDGTRPRQYTCPAAAAGGCGHCRRDVETADAWVIAHVMHWTRPDGPYAEYVTAEQMRYDAGRAAVAAELAALETEQETLRGRRAGITAALASGEITPGDAMWEITRTAARQIEDQLAAGAARIAKLMSSAMPASPERQRADLALLNDPAAPVAVRADLVRRFVAKVIIRPPGQGTRRVFDPSTVVVVPGPWADGIASASLEIAPPAGKATRHARDVVLEYVTAHPGATGREIAEGCDMSHSFACTVLAKLRDAGEVAGDRERGTGRAPVHFTRAA